MDLYSGLCSDGQPAVLRAKNVNVEHCTQTLMVQKLKFYNVRL